ncbi:MarR family winged helix-turn-helix transcriptional regulator [Actinomadura montaniterrae]|uniref:Winged helix-turn-helix transcriptional regulator n=1 Tax=Actinomadura montaniterrae TaxID=1803903 RepID=A0A6L3W3W0_9ACTN|nr:MarR family winged helix-turn-helix transcriptional regulator [Actinomadura montaniterrae]KAB2382712.1 winged helix-turn-helix transcriptional regulator [Actinomadura montaniterrae]
MPDHEHLAERLRTSIGALVRITRSQADALAPPVAQTLGLLDRDGEASIASLAQRRRVRHQSQSRTVKDLEDLGYVHRRHDPHDGRGRVIAITPEGRAALDRDRRARRDWLAAAIATTLTPAEQDVLAELPALLDRLTAHAADTAEPR